MNTRDMAIGSTGRTPQGDFMPIQWDRRKYMAALLSTVLLAGALPHASAQAPIARFQLSNDELTIRQPVRAHHPFSVTGESGAILGEQDGGFELWAFPIKILSHLRLRADVADYPIPIDVNAHAARMEVSPDHTTIVYSHAAFTVKQHMFVPRGVEGQTLAPIVFFEISSVRPLTLTVAFDPIMQRMWPALNGGRPSADWVAASNAYLLNTDDPFLGAVVAMPGSSPGILAPYQERPKDYPLEFRIAFDSKRDAGKYFPLVSAVVQGSRGKEAHQQLIEECTGLLRRLPEIYATTRAYYDHFFDSRLYSETPDKRFDAALRWAEISMDQLRVRRGAETGFVAGVFTSSDSDRPGFGWFFGRDSLWSVYAVHSYGDFSLARKALTFLIARQRADGKIMHEYSQSADHVDWDRYGYEYAAADSTPLFVMAMEDYLRSSGDLEFIRQNWDAVRHAYQFTREHDSDGDGIYDNSQGTGWVESWPPSMPKQELYLASLDQQSCVAMARLASALGDAALAVSASKQAELIRGKLAEYRGNDGMYAFSRNPDGTYDRTRTVFPSAAWWSGDLFLPDADKTLDSYAGSDLSADWGLRAVAATDPVYDPMSYHQGSVWPLFTGWAIMAEYRTHRPLAAFQHLEETIDLTWESDPGNVTELLSGTFYEPFGRSTAHQLWSSAMIITPAVRGLFGVEADVPHHRLRVDPQLPADWNNATLYNVPYGTQKIDLHFERQGREMRVTATSNENLALCLTTSALLSPQPCPATSARQHTLNVLLPQVELTLPHTAAMAGDRDRAPRVVHLQSSPHKIVLAVELLAGSTVSLPIHSNLPTPPAFTAHGAEIRNGNLAISAPAGSGYQRQNVELTW